jgi:hypothetical protein
MVAEKIICIKDFYFNDNLLIKAGCDLFESYPNWNVKKDIFRYIKYDEINCFNLKIKEFWPKTEEKTEQHYTKTNEENNNVEEISIPITIITYNDLEIKTQEMFDEYFVLIKEFKKHKQRVIDAGLFTDEIKKKTSIKRDWRVKK